MIFDICYLILPVGGAFLAAHFYKFKRWVACFGVHKMAKLRPQFGVFYHGAPLVLVRVYNVLHIAFKVGADAQRVVNNNFA